MNERIKELGKQAEEYAFDELDKLQGPVEMSISKRVFDQSFREKFAELIVRECIEKGNVLMKHYINNHSEQKQVFLLTAIADYSNEIEKHFGVEK